jgi:hypothetical protein
MYDLELLAWLEHGFQQKRDYYERDRNRWIENGKIYWGVDYSQYPMQVVQQLLDEGRQAPTLNIMAQKMDGLRGSLLRNQFDMKYVPVEGDVDDWALKLQSMWYSDKDTMNWDWSYDVFLRDFLIQCGAEWMDVDTSLTPFGNITFKPDVAYNLFPDPGWKTPFHKDMKELDKIAFYTPLELKKLYPKKAKEIDEYFLKMRYRQRQLNQRDNFDYGHREIGPPYQNIEFNWNSRRKVIERHYIVEEVRDWEYNVRDGEVFPETGYAPQSKEDIVAKKHYIEQRGLTPDDIRFLPQNHRRYHITTGCPELETILEDKDSMIQIGQIPCFMTGPAKFGSQFRGIGDMARDVQLNVNRYIMMMGEILNRSARGGMFINEDIVGGDLQRMRAIEREWNNPAARLWIKPVDPAMVDKYIKEFPSAHIPNDLMSFHNLMNEYADKLTYQTPAAEGRVESSKESGKLYQSKFEAHIIARGTIDKMLEMHQYSKAEAYMRQAKISYSGVPRQFSTKDGKSKFWINRGTPQGMEWDVNEMGRQKVIIIPSQKGIDVRINQRGVFVELKMGTRDPLMAAIYDDRIVDTVEMSDDQKDEAKQALALIKQEAAMAKALNIANMKSQLSQLGQQGAQQAEEGAEAGSQPPVPPVTPEKGPSVEEGKKGTPLEEMTRLKNISQKVTQRPKP